MNNKTKYLSFFLTILVVGFIAEITYIQNKYSLSTDHKNAKNTYVSVVGLPDLAISTETMYVRYRSLSSAFEIFKDDPTIYTYFPSTFAISYSGTNTNISRIKND